MSADGCFYMALHCLSQCAAMRGMTVRIYAQAQSNAKGQSRIADCTKYMTLVFTYVEDLVITLLLSTNVPPNSVVCCQSLAHTLPLPAHSFPYTW